MKAFIFTMIAICGLAIAASAQTVETLTVPLGQQKKAGKSDLRVSFIQLINDSRCPANAKCVWAGSAKIKISVSRPGAAKQTFDLNTGVDPKTVTAFGYEIKIAELLPYPALEHKEIGGKRVKIPRSATLTITKTRQRMPKQ